MNLNQENCPFCQKQLKSFIGNQSDLLRCYKCNFGLKVLNSEYLSCILMEINEYLIHILHNTSNKQSSMKIYGNKGIIYDDVLLDLDISSKENFINQIKLLAVFQ